VTVGLAPVHCDRCGVAIPHPEELPTPPGGWAGAGVLCRGCRPAAAAPGQTRPEPPPPRPVRFREFL
jgi:hypothetical protein